MAKSNIDISINSYLNDVSFTPNHLHLNLKGKNVNHVVINTLRRTILEDIPSYGFNVNNINPYDIHYNIKLKPYTSL